MSHSYTKITVHLVFSTKNRESIITESIEDKLYEYIKKQLKEMGCFAIIINGMPDHIHILAQTNPILPLAQIVKQIKGSSSHWINQLELTKERFSWQTGYGAFSVSESQLDKVKNYIANQKQHHAKHSFENEYNEFLLLHNIQIGNG